MFTPKVENVLNKIRSNNFASQEKENKWQKSYEVDKTYSFLFTVQNQDSHEKTLYLTIMLTEELGELQ